MPTERSGTAESEPRLLSAATGPVSRDESASQFGMVPWYRRRSPRIGLAALLVIAVFSALLLRCGESTSRVKPAESAAPRATPAQGARVPNQVSTPLPPDSISSSSFTFPSIFGNPNDGAADVTGGGFAFVNPLPGASSVPMTVPVENPAPVAPTGGL